MLEDWKIKIAVLWSVMEFCVITFGLVLPSIPMETVAETTPGEISAIIVSSLIPPIMAFLSLTLKDKANRWLNIIVGIVFIVLIPIGTGFELIPADYLPSIIVIAIVQVVALALIIWYAWKSKQKV
jgi:hypothetical protein